MNQVPASTMFPLFYSGAQKYWAATVSGSGFSEAGAPIWGALLKLAAGRGPSKSLCKPSFSIPLLGSTTVILLSTLEIQGLNFLCQHLKILRT
jgi:hypothetical protein